LETILHLDKGWSREFAFQPAEEEKAGWCDSLAIERMSNSLESELSCLL
jgi:hypothetical protein